MILDVMIVDDLASIRMALQAGLEARGEVHVRAHADGQSALDDIIRKRPDVVVLDILMPGMSGIECARTIKRHWPSLPVVMLTACGDLSNLLAALRAGADGYLVKPVNGAECMAAIREVLTGGAPLSKAVGRLLVGAFRETPPESAKTIALTRREQQVMAILADGCTDKGLAERLNISTGTVHAHLKRIYRKLGVENRQSAVARYFKMPAPAPTPQAPSRSQADALKFFKSARTFS